MTCWNDDSPLHHRKRRPRRTYPRGDVRGLPLSHREQEVLYERAMTGSEKDAAAKLGIALQTCKNHATSIYAKLGVQDIAGAWRAVGWLRPTR